MFKRPRKPHDYLTRSQNRWQSNSVYKPHTNKRRFFNLLKRLLKYRVVFFLFTIIVTFTTYTVFHKIDQSPFLKDLLGEPLVEKIKQQQKYLSKLQKSYDLHSYFGETAFSLLNEDKSAEEIVSDNLKGSISDTLEEVDSVIGITVQLTKVSELLLLEQANGEYKDSIAIFKEGAGKLREVLPKIQPIANQYIDSGQAKFNSLELQAHLQTIKETTVPVTKAYIAAVDEQLQAYLLELDNLRTKLSIALKAKESK